MVVSQLAFIPIVIVATCIIVGVPLVTILAAIAVGTIAFLVRKHAILNAIALKLEAFGTCGLSKLGYITAAEALENKKSNSDDLVGFNRRDVRGRVSTSPAFLQRGAQQQQAQGRVRPSTGV